MDTNAEEEIEVDDIEVPLEIESRIIAYMNVWRCDYEQAVLNLLKVGLDHWTCSGGTNDNSRRM